MNTCKDCGHKLHVVADGSTICALCYVHGKDKAKRIVKSGGTSA